MYSFLINMGITDCKDPKVLRITFYLHAHTIFYRPIRLYMESVNLEKAEVNGCVISAFLLIR